MTVHYESIEALVRGAEYQDANAATARETAAQMAQEVEALTNRLSDLKPRLAAAEQAALDAERLAKDFRAMAADYCKRNGWEMPEPLPAEPGETPDAEIDAEQVRAALAEEPDAAKENDDEQ